MNESLLLNLKVLISSHNIFSKNSVQILSQIESITLCPRLDDVSGGVCDGWQHQTDVEEGKQVDEDQVQGVGHRHRGQA